MAQQKPTAIIVAAGRGERFGGAIRKQFMPLGPKPVLAWALDTFEATSLIGEVILVVHRQDMTTARRNILERYGYRKLRLVEGGATRQASTWQGLQAVAAGTDYVLVHDGVRPILDEGLIRDVVRAARKHGAAAAAIPELDTVVRVRDQVMDGPLDRTAIWRLQTPQAFRFDLLFSALEARGKQGLLDATDESTVVHAAGHPVHLVPGRPENLKITTTDDLVLAAAVLRERGDL